MTLANADPLLLVFSAALVFIMQAGFLCLEAGLTRTKNSIGVALKNLADFSLSTMVFWMVGYGLMFGTSIGGFIGGNLFFPELHQDLNHSLFFVYQAMFCGTAVTILSGATAERMRFISYITLSIFISTLIYPIIGHWIIGGTGTGAMTGWLGRMGFVDFAGATFVHSVGGWLALATLIIIGPRVGRFDENGKPIHIVGSNLPLSTLGVLLLWIGWLGFNGGSNMTVDATLGRIIVNTLMGGAAGLTAGIIFSYFDKESPAVLYLMNGILSGLVGVTGNAHVISTASAVAIGFSACCVAIILSNFLLSRKIDDPVDAIAVHLGAGTWSTLCLAIFGDLTLLGTGLGRLEQLTVQSAGILATALWAFGFGYLGIWFLNNLIGFRISEQGEIDGLNVSEHNTPTELSHFFNVLYQQAETNDLSLRMPVEPFTEVGQIATQYNRVMNRLQASHEREQTLITRLQDLLEREKQFAEMRGDVINTVSHEFMTPLTVIKNASYMLSRYNDRLTPEKRKTFHTDIDAQVEAMSSQLDYILEVNNPYEGLVNERKLLTYGTFCELLNRYLSEHFPRAEIIQTHEGNAEDDIILPPGAIFTIVKHLVDNAIKFSDKVASVTLSTCLADANLKVTVADTGIGIPMDDLSSIFELFYRGGNIDTRRGLGVGLFLVQKYVTELGGTVWATPNVPSGSIFSCLIPVTHVALPANNKLAVSH